MSDDQLIGNHGPSPHTCPNGDDDEIMGPAPMPDPVLGQGQGIDVVGGLTRQSAGLGDEGSQVAASPAKQRRRTHLSVRIDSGCQRHTHRGRLVRPGELVDKLCDGLCGRFYRRGVRLADISGPDMASKPGHHRVQLPRHHLHADESRSIINHHQWQGGTPKLFCGGGASFLENPGGNKRRGQPGHRAGAQTGALGHADPRDGTVAQHRLHH